MAQDTYGLKSIFSTYLTTRSPQRLTGSRLFYSKVIVIAFGVNGEEHGQSEHREDHALAFLEPGSAMTPDEVVALGLLGRA
jgi:hypothetical protein